MKTILIVLCIWLAGCGEKIVNEAQAEPLTQVPEPQTVPVVEVEAEPEEVPEPKMSEREVRLLGQLSAGIFRIKQRRDRGNWFYCGELLSEQEQRDKALEIALALMQNLESVNLQVDPWGILGTMYNESGFDPCSLGLNPRKWAYDEGILERNVTNISHSAEEVWEVMSHPKALKRYEFSGFDLGFCQILTRFYPGQEDELMSLEPGIRICVIEMQARALRHKTTLPWLYWRGSETEWYLTKVQKHIVRMKGKRRR